MADFYHSMIAKGLIKKIDLTKVNQNKSVSASEKPKKQGLMSVLKNKLGNKLEKKSTEPLKGVDES